MPTLNSSIPQFDCLVRAEFLYDFDECHEGDLEPGVCHAVSCLSGRALGFHVLLHNGAHIGRLPIHALVANEDAPRIPCDAPWQLQLWDCFSYDFAVTEFDWMSGMRCRVALPSKETIGGEYMFTIDYYNSQAAESAGDHGWKCHHIIELDNGLFAAQPNNRVCFFEPSSVKPFDRPPKYRTMNRTWKVEDGAKWRTSDDDRMFYEVESKDAPDATDGISLYRGD